MSQISSSTPSQLWDSVADDYEEHSYQGKAGAYPANSFRTDILLDFFRDQPKGKVLDAGCGTGHMTRKLLELGWDVTSVDFSQGMLDTAERKTVEVGLDGKFQLCSVFELKKLGQTFDHIMLNGVLPYITVEEEPKVFAQLHEILNPNGYLVTSHYNFYFDIFSFDRWTIDAIVNQILIPSGVPKKEIAHAKTKIDSLLNNSDKVLDQKRTMKTENPLTYRQKLQDFGFEQFDLAYYNLFYLPAKFEAEQTQSVRKKLEHLLRRDPKGLLLARTFVSLAKRVG